MKKNRYVFWGLVISTLISALDANIMQTASPTIVKQLGGMELFAWIFVVYMLASTVTVPLYGKLSDMYGRKKLLILAVAIFTVGSILCGLANSIVTLIIFRGVQGIGAGGMIPLSMIIVVICLRLKAEEKFKRFLAAYGPFHLLLDLCWVRSLWKN